ncbi:MAG: MOSC domain-containing protein [Deinococcales bacterium]
MAEVVALYAGRIQSRDFGGRRADTAIAKTEVHGPVWVGRLGLKGDDQADKRNHGGEARALCVYPEERYAYWEGRLGRPLAPPAFGENARVAGRLEDEVALGEVWQVAGVRLQVTEPRVPCWMPGAHNGEPQLTAWMADSGFTGYLLRVLEEGEIEAGAPVTVIERPARPLTVMELNRLYFKDRDDAAGLRRALAADGLLDEWRAILEKQLVRAGRPDQPST